MANIEQAYLRGFCKTAEAHGVNPEALAKFAQLRVPRRTPAQRTAFLRRTIHDIGSSMPNQAARDKYLSMMRRQYPEAMYGSSAVHETPALPQESTAAASRQDVTRSYIGSLDKKLLQQ